MNVADQFSRVAILVRSQLKKTIPSEVGRVYSEIIEQVSLGASRGETELYTNVLGVHRDIAGEVHEDVVTKLTADGFVVTVRAPGVLHVSWS